MGNCMSSKYGVPYHEQPDDMAGRSGSVSADQGALAEQKWNHKSIEKYMKADERMAQKTKKLLLLGAGSSGKSTLFKQLKQIYKDGLQNEPHESKAQIRENCITSMLVLLKKGQFLYDRRPHQHSDCFINLEQEENRGAIQHIQNLVQFSSPSTMASTADDLDEESCRLLRDALTFLWGMPQIKNTWSKRQYFSFVENMDYFFDQVDVLFTPNYEPSVEDTLRCRIRTTGSFDQTFRMKDGLFRIFDAGGQRNERKKWIQLFEGVTAIIFVAALNHYCTVLFEDEMKNSMHESIQLFDELVNAKWFKRTEIILFLNKDDLFRLRLKQGVSLSLCFSEASGWEGPYWTGKDYVPRKSEEEDEEDDEDEDEEEEKHNDELNEIHAEALQFIREQYEAKNENPMKKVFVHTTTATSQDSVKKVFWDVQNIVVSGNMKTSGLV